MEILTPFLFLVIAKKSLYEAETFFFMEKLRKFPFETYIALN